MARLSSRLLRKLDAPPAGPNWVRFIHPDVERTAKAIVQFAVGQPPFGYLPAYRGIKDRLELRISRVSALHIAKSRGAPIGWSANVDLVNAFYDYDETRSFSATNPITFDREYFRISRDILIPVAPLSILRERGKFVPIFVVGWKSNPLTLTQSRLLMTMYEDAFFTLTDYQDSPAEVLFFPEIEEGHGKIRRPEVWSRGDYNLLSAIELRECVEIFTLARDIARGAIEKMIVGGPVGEIETVPTSTSTPDLFDLK